MTEGCRGDGAHVLDKGGRRFVVEAEPEEQALASREVVSRHMVQCMRDGRAVAVGEVSCRDLHGFTGAEIGQGTGAVGDRPVALDTVRARSSDAGPRAPGPSPDSARDSAATRSRMTPAERRRLGALLALAALNAAWSLFQWGELVDARTGGEVFCGLGGGGACADVWDSPFASAVGRYTGLPVAAWGVVWSLVAFALPVWVWRERAAGRDGGLPWSGTLVTALGGVVGVLVLAAASLSTGRLCTNCAITYAVVLAYAGVVLVRPGSAGVAELRRGAGVAAAATLAGFLALLYPGLRTPAADDTGLSEIGPEPSGGEVDPDAIARANARPERVLDLSPRYQQELSNALAYFEQFEPQPLRSPRSVYGDPHAPVRITEFTDVLCTHCANLYGRLERLRKLVPEGSLAIEPRQFPLDAACNPALEHRAETPVRCLAARALICVEGRPGAFEYTGALFARNRDLGVEDVYRLAEPLVSRDELEACVDSKETQAKLADDIEWARELGITGTPLVLVNGRKAPASDVFLYAMVVTRGNPEHPVFEKLPPSTLPPQ